MLKLRLLSRAILLALGLLSACAARGLAVEDPSPAGEAYGAFLEARFADSQFALKEAAHYYRQASAADPTDPILRRQAFLASFMAGDADAVPLAASVPDDPVATLLLIAEAARQGAWPTAISRIHSLPNDGLTQILSPLLLAWAEQGAGETDAALANLKPFVSGPGARGIDVLHAALIADLAGRTAVAAQYYNLARKAFSNPNLQLARILASWEARQGESDAASATLAALGTENSELAIVVPALEKDLSHRPVTRATDGMAEAFLAVAGSLRQQDSPDSSVVMLRLALALAPRLTPARLLLSDVFSSQQQPAAALAVLAPVPASDPLVALVDLRRAMLLDAVGKTDDALALLKRVAARYPDMPQPKEVTGDILRAHERWSEAIGAYDQAIAELSPPRPSDWTLFYDRGIAYDQVHDWPKAESDFRAALGLEPNQPYVLNYLGYSWAVQGRHLSEAREMVAKAAKLRPNDGAILDSLGYVMLRQGDVPGALQWLLRAVTLEPDDATINGHLGDAYWAAGDKLQAWYQWQHALTMHPSATEAARLEAKLKRGFSQAEGSGVPTSSATPNHGP
ncbi:MAG: tetratricopeptide repeat protein [Acetobacteraceae bacterium]